MLPVSASASCECASVWSFTTHRHTSSPPSASGVSGFFSSAVEAASASPAAACSKRVAYSAVLPLPLVLVLVLLRVRFWPAAPFGTRTSSTSTIQDGSARARAGVCVWRAFDSPRGTTTSNVG
jgi:hypothetical protein